MYIPKVYIIHKEKMRNHLKISKNNKPYGHMPVILIDYHLYDICL